ncbi:MAG: tRNA 2-thiouridine(34) synthase MnmA [Alphaproteobacteria bacterium]|nr:tRNA 2-thiouridine(34) synthase MnmA [Alphaproteobacteria bacterium]
MNSLAIDKAPAATRVVVAMSGGVDSSVTAALLREQGYDVVGITLQLYDHGAAIGRAGACCAGQDILDARRVAEQLAIPHYVLDYESRFRAEVMDAFAESYLRGETPVPCIECNRTVKFRDLMRTARELGADVLATGHYVQRLVGRSGPELHRAADPSRDQSYFLFGTTAEQLDILRFPLGGLSKPETRAMAQRFALSVADKPDSQDICFVPNGDYASVVTKLRPRAQQPGDIVDLEGRVVGRHDGIVRFTVGQRRGLALGGRDGTDNEPLYVVRLEPASCRVVVGPRSALGCREIVLRDFNWLGEPLLGALPVQVRVRSSQPLRPATLDRAEEGAYVRFHEPEVGVSPGQACVVYDADRGSRVLGGGFILRGGDLKSFGRTAALRNSQRPAT